MRILHLADLHLGKIIFDLHLTVDQQHILEQIVAIAVREKVDVVVISGDLYDRSIPPVQATMVMDDFLSRLLIDHGIKVIITPGNHDSAERLAFASRLLKDQGLFIASGMSEGIAPVILHDDAGPVTFWPLPYIDPLALKRHLGDLEIDDFDSAMERVVASLPLAPGRNLCLAHCFTGGGEASESERPLTIGGSSLVDPLHFAPFELTLLGHLHRPQQVGAKVFYAGSPLKYSFSETGQSKVVAIFDLAADGSFTRTLVELVPLREMRTLSGELTEILAAAANDPGADDYLWIELTDRSALFDYAAKLRTAYPNLLNITRTAYAGNGTSGDAIVVRNKSESEIVSAFFHHVSSNGLSSSEASVLAEVLNDLLRQEQGEESCDRSN
ncbi:MAG: exonuclease sbcCD subunit D [Deltaproteobacteria bacterium HGW-Deltaproteobacteria-4]|nr:MAG: exonuclease sbcCD subunit D [Deltaproteobacteria bacterium HGW-Deltaproteobacteria-4]